MTAGRINRRLYSGTGVRGVNCVSDCSHSPSNLAVTRPRFASPFKQFTCYPHCVDSSYMPSVSLAEGVHIGARSATSAVRLSLSHRRVRLTFIAFKTSRTPLKHRSLHAAAFGTMCDFSPLLGRSTCRCSPESSECCNRQSPRPFGVTFCSSHSALSALPF